jgi:hypothetical protein
MTSVENTWVDGNRVCMYLQAGRECGGLVAAAIFRFARDSRNCCSLRRTFCTPWRNLAERKGTHSERPLWGWRERKRSFDFWATFGSARLLVAASAVVSLMNFEDEGDMPLSNFCSPLSPPRCFSSLSLDTVVL